MLLTLAMLLETIADCAAVFANADCAMLKALVRLISDFVHLALEMTLAEKDGQTVYPNA